MRDAAVYRATLTAQRPVVLATNNNSKLQYSATVHNTRACIAMRIAGDTQIN